MLCVFGPETEATEVVDFEIAGIRSGRMTRGHRFMAPGEIEVRRFDDYVPKLEKAKVVLDADRRKQIVLADARDRALALNLTLVEDEGLLEEVAGLVEWPVVLTGTFDERFLAIPPEVIRTTIRANQKCFVLQKHDGSGLANRFILVANIEAKDGGKAIVAGNQRVIAARLSDALYFWETDRKPLPGYEKNGKPFDQRLAKLKAQNIVFHEKLGTQGERVDRIVRLAKEIAPLVGADPQMAERAAMLAKADLMTEVVGEFPELQGLMGKYYALEQGEDPSVATAIEEHYKPLGPSDRVPKDPVAIAVALADKLDILTGFWAIGEKPTGSKDPYALRRAALGVIRIVLENGLRVRLLDCIRHAGFGLLDQRVDRDIQSTRRAARTVHELGFDRPNYAARLDAHQKVNPDSGKFAGGLGQAEAQLPDFFNERLKVQLRDQGARHDLVDAVIAVRETRTLPGDESAIERQPDDLVLIVRGIEALGKFLETDDGRQLLAGTKRGANILREEEKKSGETYAGAVDAKRLVEPEERALYEAIGAAEGEVKAAVAVEDFADAMRALAKLRPPVDAFFDKVLVNAKEPDVRVNRLRLLNRIREATLAVADFSKIAG